MRRGPREQSGDEAARPASSPPGVRFGLALFGLVMSLGGMLVLGVFARAWWAVAVLALIAVVASNDMRLQAQRMRRSRRGGS
jgi:hypothetical protein